MEKMTESERQKLKDLQAKAKRVERAEKDFWANVEERKDEILAKYGQTDNRLEQIAAVYGCSVDELISYIISERQVSYYKNTH